MDNYDVSYINLRDNRRLQAYAILKCRIFGHTKAFDSDLLQKTGTYTDFARICHVVGWDGFVSVEENGSRLLTIQFLCTHRVVDDGLHSSRGGRRCLFPVFGEQILFYLDEF